MEQEQEKHARAIPAARRVEAGMEDAQLVRVNAAG